MGAERKTERVTVRMTPSFKEAITELAAKEKRTVSNYIELLLAEKLEEENDKK